MLTFLAVPFLSSFQGHPWRRVGFRTRASESLHRRNPPFLSGLTCGLQCCFFVVEKNYSFRCAGGGGGRSFDCVYIILVRDQKTNNNKQSPFVLPDTLVAHVPFILIFLNFFGSARHISSKKRASIITVYLSLTAHCIATEIGLTRSGQNETQTKLKATS